MLPPHDEASAWPGVETAYEFVRPSYELLLRRAELAEARARATGALAGTLMFAAPAFVTATLGVGSRSFLSWWFLAAALAFVGVVVCMVVQQLPIVGDMQAISPRRLVDDGYLEDNPATFKLNVVLYAAEDWDTNTQRMTQLMAIAAMGAGLLAVQLVCLAVWVFLG